MIKLSVTSKLGCKSWSLQAGDTCPGSYARDGSLVDACTGCYAKGGNYRFRNVVAVREHNKADWQRASFVPEFVASLSGETHFRWFDSGDMYSVALARKILSIMTATPHCKHWLPTRMYKFSKFRGVLAQMEALPNVVVRRSSDAVNGTFDATHGSTILPTPTAPKGVTLCKAYAQQGQCMDCRACWSKDVPVVGYVAHGKSMGKLLRVKQLAA
jgi:hypothetical protein